jgi:uroporphyrinogen-III synthase
MHILLTRPIEDSQRTVEQLRTLGHKALVAPLFVVTPLKHVLPDKPDMLIATSANAIRFCKAEAFASWLNLPFLTVGDATAKAAKDFGFSHVLSADANSIALAALIKGQAIPGASLLQLAGQPRRDAAIQALRADYQLTTVETYVTVAHRNLPDAIADALRGNMVDVVLHFSPRAAIVFMNLVEAAELNEAASKLKHICISAAAVDPRFLNVTIASQPSLNAMLKAISKA